MKTFKEPRNRFRGSIPPGWESISGLLKRITNTGPYGKEQNKRQPRFIMEGLFPVRFSAIVHNNCHLLPMTKVVTQPELVTCFGNMDVGAGHGQLLKESLCHKGIRRTTESRLFIKTAIAGLHVLYICVCVRRGTVFCYCTPSPFPHLTVFPLLWWLETAPLPPPPNLFPLLWCLQCMKATRKLKG